MHIKKWNEWSILSKILICVLGVCLACIALALIWHPFADWYTNRVYTQINVPLAFLSSILPFSFIGFFSTWRIPVLCILLLLFGILFFALKPFREKVLQIGVPILYVYLILFGHSLIGSSYYDNVQYGWIFLLSFGTSILFLIFLCTFSGRLSPATCLIWWRVLIISLIVIAIIGTFLLLLPALTSTITDQNNKANVQYSQADMVEYGMSCLDDLETTYQELIALCGSPEKVVFPSYALLENELKEAMHKASAEYPALHGFYPSVRFYDHESHIFDKNTIGLFVPGTCEILIQDNLRNSSLPNTIAHEYAHLKGYLRESEADYIADFVCINADNPWIRYSGYYHIFSRMLTVLKQLGNVTDYNALVTRYNKIFNDAKSYTTITPEDGTLMSHANAFVAGADQQLSAGLTLSITCPIADYAWVREQLTSNPQLVSLAFSLSVAQADENLSTDRLIKCTIDATLNGPLGESTSEAVLAALDQLLSAYRTKYAENATWTVTARVNDTYTQAEKIDRFKEDYEDILMDSLDGKRLYIAIPFSYQSTDASTYDLLISKLQEEAQQLKSALAGIQQSDVTFTYEWSGQLQSSIPEQLTVVITIALPAEEADDTLPSLIRENLPSMQTSAYTSSTFRLDRQPTAAEIKAEQEKQEKDRQEAASVFNPVSYFSFASAGSDYGTSIRYLMEKYLK